MSGIHYVCKRFPLPVESQSWIKESYDRRKESYDTTSVEIRVKIYDTTEDCI